MSAPHPLNMAVIAQALADFSSGQFRRCLAMGFTASDLEALKRPETIGVLINAHVPWCTVQVHSKALQGLLARAQATEREIQVIDRLLQLGASTEMLHQFFALDNQEVAFRRQVLGLPLRKGRWPELTEEEDTALWTHWDAQVKARGIALDDEMAMLTLGADLAEARALPLSLVWSAIRNWSEQARTHVP